MSITGFPGGISSWGVPVLPPGGGSLYPNTGQVWFVDNASYPSLAGYTGGVDNNATNGKTPQAPFATTQYAINQCKANNGDIIYIGPGHAETIISAGGINANVAGITICGLASGNIPTRPTYTFNTSTAATFLISASNVTLRNLKFDGTQNNVSLVTMVSVAGSGVTGTWFDNCEMYVANATTTYSTGYAVSYASASNANYTRYTNNWIHGDAAQSGCTNAIQFTGGNYVQFEGNYIQGAFTTTLGGINNITAAMTDVIFDSNLIVNETAASTVAVCLLASGSYSRAEFKDNRFGIQSGAAPVTAYSGAAGTVQYIGNYYCGSAQVSVLL